MIEKQNIMRWRFWYIYGEKLIIKQLYPLYYFNTGCIDPKKYIDLSICSLTKALIVYYRHVLMRENSVCPV